MINTKNCKMFEPFFWIYFTWYYLPFARGMFNKTIHNLLFFAFFICGFLLLVFQIFYENKRIPLKINILTPVLCYMFTAIFLYLFEIGDMGRHIRISFTFWGTLIVFCALTLFKDARKRLAKLLLLLVIITIFTSIIGVVLDPNAARTLTFSENAMEEDIQLKMKNIADIFLFQGLVVCVPIFITNIFKKKKIFWSIMIICIILFALLSASFTISLILFFVSIILGIIFNTKSQKTKIFLIICTILALFVPWVDLFVFISENIPNEIIGTKLKTIIVYGMNGVAVGGLSSRLDLYSMSLETFLENPLGIGPEYKFIVFSQGVGYHSQILDDMARYGVLAIMFYVIFYVEYYKLIKIQWRKIDMEQVAMPIVILYFIFLVLNPGFTSPYEGVLMFFVLPILPEILDYKKRVRIKIKI